MGYIYRVSAQPLWKWPNPLRPFGPWELKQGRIPLLHRRGFVGRFRLASDKSAGRRMTATTRTTGRRSWRSSQGWTWDSGEPSGSCSSIGGGWSTAIDGDPCGRAESRARGSEMGKGKLCPATHEVIRRQKSGGWWQAAAVWKRAACTWSERCWRAGPAQFKNFSNI
jgi:hypothetical protein